MRRNTMWVQIGNSKFNIDQITEMTIRSCSEEEQKTNGQFEAYCFIHSTDNSDAGFYKKVNADNSLSQEKRDLSNNTWGEILRLNDYLNGQLI